MSHLTSSSVFATVMHLYCIFGSSSCVLFRRTRSDRLCIFRFHYPRTLS